MTISGNSVKIMDLNKKTSGLLLVLMQLLIMPVVLCSQNCNKLNVTVQINDVLPGEESISSCTILFNAMKDTLHLKYTIGEIYILDNDKFNYLLKDFTDSMVSIEFFYIADFEKKVNAKYSMNISAKNLLQRYCLLRFTNIKAFRIGKRLKHQYYTDYFSPLETGMSPRYSAWNEGF